MDMEAPSGARSQYLRSNERGGFPIQADDTVLSKERSRLSWRSPTGGDHS